MAAGKVVRRSVAATNPETGDVKWFHDGDTLDAEWAEFVTNPAAFEPIPPDEGKLGGDDPKALRSLGSPEMNSTEPGGVEVAGDAGYEGMNKSELEEALEDRGLAKTGTRPQLVERLQAHDAANG